MPCAFGGNGKRRASTKHGLSTEGFRRLRRVHGRLINVKARLRRIFLARPFGRAGAKRRSLLAGRRYGSLVHNQSLRPLLCISQASFLSSVARRDSQRLAERRSALQLRWIGRISLKAVLRLIQMRSALSLSTCHLL